MQNGLIRNSNDFHAFYIYFLLLYNCGIAIIEEINVFL